MSQAVKLGDQGHRFAAPGGNHCLEVVQTNSGDQPSFRVVTRFDAHGKNGAPALAPSMRLLGTLHHKDSVLVEVPGLAEPVLGVVQTMSGKSTVGSEGLDVRVRDARDARESGAGNKCPLIRIKSRGRWNEARVTLAGVDPLGRVNATTPLFTEQSE